MPLPVTLAPVGDPVFFTPLTPLSFLERSALAFPQRVAIVDGTRRLTWADFRERVRRLALALQRNGIERGDRVAYLAPNVTELLEAHYGVPRAGAVLVAINTRLARDEIAYILEHSGSRVLVVHDSLAPLVEGLPVERMLVCGDEYERFLDSAGEGEPEDRLQSELDPISVNYTSGTTGRPKGVVYTHRGAYLNALSEGLHAKLDSRSVYLWTLPMFHCNGWCFTWGVTAVAGTHICLRRVEPARVWELIDTEGVTHYNGAPTVHVGVVNDPRAHPLARPVTVTVAGAPPSPTLLARMRDLGFRPVHVYGLTETYGPHTVCGWHEEWDALPPEEQARLAARQGQGYALFDLVRVVDANMNDVPRDGQTLGEVIMRGNNAALGYFKQSDATAEAFRGGWFHSGDIAVWHPDGYIELRDRKKDIIISGGENISTIEVEQAVVKHPAVLECAVVAIPDEKWGERPKAFVTLKPGQRATAAEIIESCRQHIAHFKCPAAIEFGDLPKTSTGKVQKFVLREREWKGKEKRIN